MSMKTLKEVSNAAGISARTLHHYDEIGILKPSAVTEAGYRLYDEKALSRLRDILLFRELRFSLKDIKKILDSPRFDRNKAIEQQIHLFTLQYERMGKIIAYAQKIQKEGEEYMCFDVFDIKGIEKYKEETRNKWGDTEPYREFLEKETAGKDFIGSAKGLTDIFKELGALTELPPENPKVQEEIGELKKFITENYYTCTDDILKGLGSIYVNDERFQKNIDADGGIGTAKFVGRAISFYCKK